MAIKAKNGTRKSIQDVLYVPDLAKNLLSLRQLVQRGYSVQFDDNNYFVYGKKNDQSIASVAKDSNIVFPLRCNGAKSYSFYYHGWFYLMASEVWTSKF